MGINVDRRRFLALSGAAVAGGAVASSLTTSSVKAFTPIQSLANWDDAVTVFDDQADSLAAAGWIVRSPVAGAYITDHGTTQGNPSQIPMKSVPAGNYLLYADEVSRSVNLYASMTKSLAVGAGAWQLELRLKIDDIPDVHEYDYTRGLQVVLTANKYRFSFSLANRNKLHALYTSGTNSYERTVPVPFDGQFHDWTIRFDGLDTTSVEIDGNAVAVFRGVNVTTTAGDSLVISALALNWARGRTEVYVERIRLRRRNTVASLGTGTNLVTSGWIVDAARVDAYITDAARSTGTVAGMKPVISGEYLLFAAAGATGPIAARHSVQLGQGGWTLRLNVKVVALPTGAGYLRIVVVAGGRRYVLNVDSAGAVSVLSGQSAAGVLPADSKFHALQIGADEFGRFFVEVDHRKVFAYQNDISEPTTAADALEFTFDPGVPATGPSEIYFSRIELARDVETVWYQTTVATVTVLPTSDRDALEALIGLADADPRELNSGALRLRSTVESTNDTVTVTPDKAYIPVTLSTGQRTGEFTVATTLSRGMECLTETRDRWKLPAAVSVAGAGSNINAQPERAWLFTDVDLCHTDGGSMPVSAGWGLGAYHYEGASDGGMFLDSTGQAQPLIVPLTITGPATIYVGFVSGTEKFAFHIGGTIKSVEIPDAPDFDPARAFGQRVLGETGVWTGTLTGEALRIAVVGDAQARIAYVRIVGLTASEAELAATPNEGATTKRAIYNNDGISDFFEGRYKTVPELQAQAVDIYAGSDVEAVAWASGATFMLTYDSEYAGAPYASLTPAQRSLMRNGDIVAMETILKYVQDGIVPLQVVASRAQQHGIAAYASLRMDTFYSMAAYPWYNGNLWSSYQDCLARSYNGTPVTNRMSLAIEKFRTYVKNVLIEQSNFTDVTGIEMDFCRYPEVIGWEAEVLAAYSAQFGADARLEVTSAGSERWQQFRADIVTGMVSEIRAALPGKPIIARVPQANTLAYGLDISAWVSQGLVDILVPTSISHEQFWPNLDEFADLVSGTDVKLYGGVTHTLSGNDLTKQEQDLADRGYSSGIKRTQMTPDMYRERANAFYRAGYDGVYVFNHWRGTESIGVLGDRVANEKWRVFSLPASWVHGAIEAHGVEPATVGELADLVAELQESADVKARYAPSLLAQIEPRAGVSVESQLRRFVEVVRAGRRSGQVTEFGAARLIGGAQLASA